MIVLVLAVGSHRRKSFAKILRYLVHIAFAGPSLAADPFGSWPCPDRPSCLVHRIAVGHPYTLVAAKSLLAFDRTAVPIRHPLSRGQDRNPTC